MTQKNIILHALGKHGPVSSSRLLDLVQPQTDIDKKKLSVRLAELKKARLIHRDESKATYDLTEQGDDWITANPIPTGKTPTPAAAKPKPAIIANAGLTPYPNHTALLEIIGDNAPLNFAELLAEFEGITGTGRDALQNLVSEAIRIGLIRRNEHQRYELTDAGEQAISAAPPAPSATENGVTQAEKADLLQTTAEPDHIDVTPDPETRDRLTHICDLAECGIDDIATRGDHTSVKNLASLLVEIRTTSRQIMRAQA